MVVYKTVHTYGLDQVFWFEGIRIHRQSGQIQFFFSVQTYFTSYVHTCSVLPPHISTMGINYKASPRHVYFLFFLFNTIHVLFHVVNLQHKSYCNTYFFIFVLWNVLLHACYLYQIITWNMFKNPIFDCSRSNQMSLTD